MISAHFISRYCYSMVSARATCQSAGAWLNCCHNRAPFLPPASATFTQWCSRGRFQRRSFGICERVCAMMAPLRDNRHLRLRHDPGPESPLTLPNWLAREDVPFHGSDDDRLRSALSASDFERIGAGGFGDNQNSTPSPWLGLRVTSMSAPFAICWRSSISLRRPCPPILSHGRSKRRGTSTRSTTGPNPAVPYRVSVLGRGLPVAGDRAHSWHTRAPGDIGYRFMEVFQAATDFETCTLYRCRVLCLTRRRGAYTALH